MPVNFLTEEQRSRYGRFNDDPDEGQLGGFFHRDAIARRRAMACRGAGNQLDAGRDCRRLASGSSERSA